MLSILKCYFLNPSPTNVHFLYPENIRKSLVFYTFRGYRKGKVV